MSRQDRKVGKARVINPALLRRWPLSAPDSDTDKEGRGTVLVAGGSAQVPGGLILSGVGALRAGAGKLQLAAPRSIAVAVGIAVIEAGVVPLSETSDGSLGKRAGRELSSIADSANAILIGPGMMGDELGGAFVKEFLRRRPDCPLVIDAACIGGLSASERLDARTVLTPHAGEMASLFNVSKESVEASPAEFAVKASAALEAVIVMKGATTFIATIDELFTYGSGDVGLATSGSGDVLSGIIAGLLARGIPPDQAAVWSVAIHGAAGIALAKKVGKIGFLARELLDEIPHAMLRGVLNG